MGDCRIENKGIKTLITVVLGIGVSQLMAQVGGLAQTPPPQNLSDKTDVPLIPQGNRPLTASERYRILDAIAQLQTQAQEALTAGDDNLAFTLWYKELELQKALGFLPEIEALTRIGAIAWEKSRTVDVNTLTARLVEIQKQVQKSTPPQPDLLNALATAYQQLRDSDKAIVIYQDLLQLALNQDDKVTEDKILQILGNLYVERFDYSNAATIYEELLKRAESQEDYFNKGLYLRKLAEIYGQALQPENAVIAKQKLADTYLNSKQIEQIPTLKIAIADDYLAINNPESASQNYQEAFSLAWSLKQLSVAGDALSKLAHLYNQHDQKDYALQVYKELIKVEQQAYDFYGLMNVYDRMGQIYAEQKNYNEALKVFQNALQLAHSLSYQESYFMGQIDNIKKQINP